MNQKGFVKDVVIIILAILLLAGGYFYFSKKPVYAPVESNQISTNQEKVTDIGGKSAVPSTGIIKGKIGYPSDSTPDEIVCAELVSDSKIKFCARFSGKNGSFELQVPEGDYYIFAMVADRPNSTWKAYYDQLVICGLNIKCKDTSLIVVTVKKGEVIEGVDPMDWYNDYHSKYPKEG